MQSVDVDTDEIALVVESVGRTHFVIINVRIIPGVDDVVFVHDFQGDKFPIFLEVASAAGHIIVNIGKYIVDMRHLLQPGIDDDTLRGVGSDDNLFHNERLSMLQHRGDFADGGEAAEERTVALGDLQVIFCLQT